MYSRASASGASLGIYGYPGAEVVGFVGALNRANGDPELIAPRHEDMGVFTVTPRDEFTGEIGCCSPTSGAGANRLLDCLCGAKLDHQQLIPGAAGRGPRRVCPEMTRVRPGLWPTTASAGLVVGSLMGSVVGRGMAGNVRACIRAVKRQRREGDLMAKVAVVTGGSAGVGRATVRELAGRGYDVAVLARGAAGLAGAVEEVRQAGRRGLSIACDVADYEAVARAGTQVEAELGEIDLWVNVAFVGSLAFAWDTSMEEFRRMTEVTYYGQVHGTLVALSRMRPRDRGVIVNVGSAMAYRSIPLQSAYCGAKHAVKGFTESVMTELAHEKSKVKLCMVQLPGLNTPQFNWNTPICRFDK